MNTEPDVADAAVLTGFALGTDASPMVGFEAQQGRLANMMESKWSHLDERSFVGWTNMPLLRRWFYLTLAFGLMS